MVVSDYGYSHGDPTGVDPSILRAVERLLAANVPANSRVLDLGCGNGYFSARLASKGFDVTGVDVSESGIEQARRHHHSVTFERVDSEDAAGMASLGAFDAVVSIEVIEHVRSTSAYVQSLRECLHPGGVAVVSTPYHGYFKNLLIAAMGAHDRHYDPLWEGGHIKFFSIRNLVSAFESQHMKLVTAQRVGRIPPLAKSIVAAFRRNEAGG